MVETSSSSFFGCSILRTAMILFRCPSMTSRFSDRASARPTQNGSLICNNARDVWALQTVAEKAGCRGVLRTLLPVRKAVVPVTTSPHPACCGHPTAPERPRPRTVGNAMGIDSVMGQRFTLAASMINARAETASTKSAFCDALKSRGCLIPAGAFYEWSLLRTNLDNGRRKEGGDERCAQRSTS
jgi:putative SOS response-associated peptidase YedK